MELGGTGPLAVEVRNERGEWRPKEGVAMAPLLDWPPRAKALVKWIFGYPGFLFPHNALLFLISALSYYFTEPALERCRVFSWDWMLFVYLRNQVLIWVYYGAFYLWLYVYRREGTGTKYDARWPARRNKIFWFHDQVRDNVFFTAGVAGLIWTAYEWVTLWMYANGRLPYLRFADHPIWFVALIFLVPIWREFHFYCVHRLIHVGWIFKTVHYLHHKNVESQPVVRDGDAPGGDDPLPVRLPHPLGGAVAPLPLPLRPAARRACAGRRPRRFRGAARPRQVPGRLLLSLSAPPLLRVQLR